MASDGYGLQRWRAARRRSTERGPGGDGGDESSPALRRVARNAPLLTRIGYSGFSQLFPLLATFILTPFLIARLGLDRFGVWSLALVLLATLTALDGGMIPSLARFFALYGARDDRASAARLFVGSSALFLLLGVVTGVITLLVGSHIVGVASIPRQFQHEAAHAILFLGPLLALALISDSVTGLLQANQRFGALAGVSACSAGCYLATAMVLVAGGGGLGALIAAVSVRYSVVIVIGLVVGSRHMRLSRPVMPDGVMRRDVWRFALPMQVSGVVTFVTGETDALVIALFLPVRYVGLYSVGYQAAVALRSLPTYAFPPLLTRMTEVFASRGQDGAVAEFRFLGSKWLQAVLGYGAVATAAVGFGVRAWLGKGFAVSELVAVVLMAGYTLHVGITGMRTCFVRARRPTRPRNQVLRGGHDHQCGPHCAPRALLRCRRCSCRNRRRSGWRFALLRTALRFGQAARTCPQARVCARCASRGRAHHHQRGAPGGHRLARTAASAIGVRTASRGPGLHCQSSSLGGRPGPLDPPPYGRGALEIRSASRGRPSGACRRANDHNGPRMNGEPAS